MKTWLYWLLGCAALAAACGKSANGPSDDDDDTFEAPKGGSDQLGSGGRHPGGGGEGGKGNGTGGGTIGAEPGRADCTEAALDSSPSDPMQGKECWDLSNCNGTSEEQFSKQCGGTCLGVFDNEQRIEGFTGTLPQLP